MPARSPVSDVNIDAPALLSIAIALPIAIVGAYALGKRHSQRARRELQRTLSGRELELLEARAEIARLAESLTGTPARERLLKLAMTRLGRARERERHLFVEVTRLRLSAAESAARLKAAVALARRAARRAREELASADGAIGTITTRAPKSYGNGKAVTVRVVDHETPAAKLDGAARVPHRERARFARLPPSNEPRSPGEPDLSAIAGLAADDEHRLNAFGIHRLEQLAALDDREQRRLGILMGPRGSGRPLSAWIGDARALLDERSTS